MQNVCPGNHVKLQLAGPSPEQTGCNIDTLILTCGLTCNNGYSYKMETETDSDIKYFNAPECFMVFTFLVIQEIQSGLDGNTTEGKKQTLCGSYFAKVLFLSQ